MPAPRTSSSVAFPNNSDQPSHTDGEETITHHALRARANIFRSDQYIHSTMKSETEQLPIKGPFADQVYDIISDEPLGSGIGTVIHARKPNGVAVAIKVYLKSHVHFSFLPHTTPKEGPSRSYLVSALEREVAINRFFKDHPHPFVSFAEACFQDEFVVYLVMVSEGIPYLL
jgi:hypothetical protein